jgi:hypothetical protein
MTDRELVAIRDALDALIALPTAARAVVVSLIGRSSPVPEDGNGLDHEPRLISPRPRPSSRHRPRGSLRPQRSPRQRTR